MSSCKIKFCHKTATKGLYCSKCDYARSKGRCVNKYCIFGQELGRLAMKDNDWCKFCHEKITNKNCRYYGCSQPLSGSRNGFCPIHNPHEAHPTL